MLELEKAYKQQQTDELLEMPKVEDDKKVLTKKWKIFPKDRSGVREIKKREKLSWKDNLYLNRFPSQSFLIEMFFSNGTSRTWVIKTSKETFEYKKRTYYLRYQDSWFNLTNNQYKLYFHEDYVCPIDRKVLVQPDNNPETVGKEKAFFSTTPSNIKGVIDMDYLRNLIGSENFNKMLKLAVIFAGVSLLLLVIHVFGIVKVG